MMPTPCNSAPALVDERPLGGPIATVVGLREFIDQRIDEHIANGGSMAPVRVLVLIHGGLNQVEQSCAHALDHTRYLAEPNHEPNTYPVFLVWPSGGSDSYADEILNVSEGERHHSTLLRATGPVQVVMDPLGGLARAPSSAVRQFRSLRDSIVYNLGAHGDQPQGLADKPSDPLAYSLRAMQLNAYPDTAGWAEITPSNNVIYDPGQRPPPTSQTLFDYTLVPVLFPSRVALTPFVDGYGSADLAQPEAACLRERSP